MEQHSYNVKTAERIVGNPAEKIAMAYLVRSPYRQYFLNYRSVAPFHHFSGSLMPSFLGLIFQL